MDLKHYIFITTEGYTFKPKSDLAEPEVENCQVLGFSDGINKEEAFKNFLKDYKYVKDLGFNDVICYEILQNNPNAYFYLNK